MPVDPQLLQLWMRQAGIAGGTAEQPSDEVQVAPASVGKYKTPLSADEESAFQDWARKNGVPWQDTPDADYDMRGFWKASQSGKASTAVNPSDGRVHYPDTFKTPYHATFSNESQYATPDAPHWERTKLVRPDGSVVTDEGAPAPLSGSPSPGPGATTPSPAGAPSDAPAASPEERYAAQQAGLDQQAAPIIDQLDALPPGDPRRPQLEGQLKTLALAGTAAKETEQARRQGVAQAEAMKRLADLQAEQDDRDRQLYEQAQRGVQAVQAAAAQVRAAAPDPAVLWGGPGSWRRALVTTLGAASSGLGGPGTAAVIRNFLDMGMADQRARYDTAVADANATAADSAQRIALIKGVDDSLAARRLALFQSLSGSLAQVANGMAPGQAKADLLGGIALAAQTLDKETAENQLKQAQAAEAMAKAAKAAGGIGGAGGGTAFGSIYGTLNDIPPNLRKQAVRLPDSPDGRPGGWFVASNEENTHKAQELVENYSGLNYDLNELQRLSVERNGAKSKGGTLWSKWQSTEEQHYQQLLIDTANRYGMIMHGRSPTAGVLEEAFKAVPSLKSFYEGGDTTDLIESFRNDTDNRFNLQLHTLGYDDTYRSGRVRPPEERPLTQLANEAEAPSAINKDGTYISRSADDRRGAIDAYVEGMRAKDMPDADVLDGLKAQLNSVEGQLAVAKKARDGQMVRVSDANRAGDKKRLGTEVGRLENFRNEIDQLEETREYLQGLIKNGVPKPPKPRTPEEQTMDEAAIAGPGVL
jgi:hypothetical protein